MPRALPADARTRTQHSETNVSAFWDGTKTHCEAAALGQCTHPVCRFALAKKPSPRGTSSRCVVGKDFTNISPELLPRKPFCFMNFCFITLLKQICSRKTRGIPLQIPGPGFCVCLSVSFSLLKKKKKKVLRNASLKQHFTFQMCMLFSVLLLL